MNKLYFLIFLIFSSVLLFGQNSEVPKIRFLTDASSLSEDKKNQLENFDFEPYRKDQEAVVIKVIDGPTIELVSRSELQSGVHTNQIAGLTKTKRSHLLLNDDRVSHHHSHHMESDDREIVTLKIISVQVFH